MTGFLLLYIGVPLVLLIFGIWFFVKEWKRLDKLEKQVKEMFDELDLG